MSHKELITAYEADVQFPDVSGMEHLDMLMTRSEIAQNAPHLSDEERMRVLNADRCCSYNKPSGSTNLSRVSPTWPVGGVMRAYHRHTGGGILM